MVDKFTDAEMHAEYIGMKQESLTGVEGDRAFSMTHNADGTWSVTVAVKPPKKPNRTISVAGDFLLDALMKMNATLSTM